MKICLDTSAINQIVDHPRRDDLIAELLRHDEIHVTALNVIEIAKTKDLARREELRDIAKRLAENREPLALPNDLLESVTRAFHARASEIKITIPADQRELWFLLSQPEALLPGGRDEIARWAHENERLHGTPAETVRASVDQLFAVDPLKRPRGPADVLRQLISGKWELHYSLPSQFYKLATERVLPLSKLDRLLREGYGIWSVFLAASALSIYYRAVWIPQHGPRSTVGVLDLWSAIYLPVCDLFVTHDLKNGGQFEALRIANTLNQRRPRTRVLRWAEFKKLLEERAG